MVSRFFALPRLLLSIAARSFSLRGMVVGFVPPSLGVSLLFGDDDVTRSWKGVPKASSPISIT
jgi:hypothetical protein